MDNKVRARISPNVVLLSIVSFLNDLSSEMIMPILPMFLESLGARGEAIGLVGGIRDSLSNLLQVLCGYWSDKTGKRKVFVYAGYAVSTVFKLLLALSRTWPIAVVFSSLERTGKGLRTAARDAIIAESMSDQRGRAFGFHRAFDTLGAVLGAAGAFVLFWFLGIAFWKIILIAGVIGLAALAPIRFVSSPEGRPQNVTLKLGIAGLPGPLKAFLVIASVFACGNFSYMFFVLRSQDLFTGRLREAAPILLYVLFNVIYSALAAPLGSISDRIGKPKVLVFGYLLFSVTTLGFAFLHSLAAYIVLFALYGAFNAAVDATQRAYVADLAYGSLKATALGTLQTVTGLAALPGGILAGYLWEQVSPQVTFLYGTSMGLLAAMLFGLFLAPRIKNK
ncbi:MAG: MFS transporter [Phycisphaerae bacterium]|nr:MFS transporter [Phycisphaerae bacterium]